jgi:hypothetical protein
MIENVPIRFKPTINTVYPPNNITEFERWLGNNYEECNTDRTYLPVFWTGYHVNNNYGNDAASIQALQEYIDSLDRSKKYWTVVQYDDSVLIDFKDLDVLRFEMSKNNWVGLPLIGQPHPFTFTGSKKHFANFIGGKTHPIRDVAEGLKNIPGYYISYEPHDIENYCRIIYDSIFTLCFRGYGLNSFRCTEAVQFGSIPVYISDEFVTPFGTEFSEYGILIHHRSAHRIDEILQSIDPVVVIEKQAKLEEIYEEYYTYEGVLKNIIRTLETEYNKREQGRQDAAIDE